jgi:probable rRNA maturation factor
MKSLLEVNFLDIQKKQEYIDIITKVLTKCYEKEALMDKNLYTNVILTTPQNIREFNKKFRNIDKETDVLSFPMFEKSELESYNSKEVNILGDVVISIDKVKRQAEEYGHSFERELSYMIIHSFYHLLGYDHIKESDKKMMRKKEKNILEEE